MLGRVALVRSLEVLEGCGVGKAAAVKQHDVAMAWMFLSSRHRCSETFLIPGTPRCADQYE